MAEGDDKDQKTEDPTAKRLREAEEKGNIPFSREVTHFMILSVLALTIGALAPSILGNTKLLLLPFLASPDDIPVDMNGLGKVLWNLTISSMGLIAIPVLCVVAAAIMSRYVQTEFVVSAEPIKPKLNKISPLAGFTRIFSMRSLVELLKNIAKFTIVGIVGYVSVASQMTHIRQLPDSSLLSIMMFLGNLSLKLAVGILIAVFFIALFDVFYQRLQHIKSLRMSKQEVKDEYKQSEGDPMIKRRLRQLRMERAKQRIMTAVPQSDVVITNPTHYSVALKYDTTTMKAPIVSAKGQDLIALKIREIAEENDIPIVENPPLARALYASTDIDQEIPMAHYEAVAKVISYVYQLKGKKM